MSSPIPHGIIGRTDQGVDIASTPGTTIVDPVPGTSQYVGTIRDWFNGQPLQWFHVLTGKFKGRYWYGAEQIDFSTGPGSIVQQGQQIGKYAQAGTATEFGWATRSGQTLAKATTGYTEGQVTPAGQSFRRAIIGGNTPNVVNVPNYVPKPYVGWVRNAASRTQLPASVVAAQIDDESGFDPNATSPTGAKGVAQFEPATWKAYGHGNPYNPQDALGGYVNYMGTLLRQYHGNVRNALAAYNAGPNNLAAGYGYADAILAKAGLPGGTNVHTRRGANRTRPGGQPANQTGASVDDVFTKYEKELNTPRAAAASGFTGKNPFGWWLQSFQGNWQNENG